MKSETRREAMRKASGFEERAGLRRDERGLSTVEYIIILMLIAVAGIALWSQFGDAVTEKVGEAKNAVQEEL
ncbi:MAG: hypothetical protein R6V85_09470 [Polyangia bacterium]